MTTQLSVTKSVKRVFEENVMLSIEKDLNKFKFKLEKQMPLLTDGFFLHYKKSIVVAKFVNES